MPMDKTFNAAEAEPRIYAKWDDAKAFAAGANAKAGKPAYSIMIPPPNVTGVLHMGHAFNNTLQDILIRWKRMQGFDTLWQPGTDHAGIATQMVVERELAKDKSNATRREMGREAFLQKVWEWKEQSGGTIINQLKRLGASCDWERTAFTMSGAPGAPKGNEGNFHDAVIKVFVEMYNKGYIYRGKRLVNWDPHFETAISDLEVENIEVPGHMWHFKYPLAGGATYEYVEKDENGNVTLRETRDYISIATTRPETMLGDGAVAVHPSDERYAPIVGKLCEIPVGPKEHRRLIPIITDEYPDPDFGSGAVKITGAHDFNDYQVAKRGGIPMYRLMDTRGAMRADGAEYAEAAALALSVARGERVLSEAEADTVNLVPDDLRGLDRFEARDRVVEQITSEGLAVMTSADDPRLGRVGLKPTLQDEGEDTATVPLVEAKPIMQPFGDRSKVVIEPMLTDQWFVDTAKIVGPALDAVKDGTVKILPESGEKTYYHWLENIEPWCISRQLWWGHQVPVWYGPGLTADGDLDYATGAEVTFCAATFAEVAAQARAHYGVDDIHEGKDFADALEDQLESFSHDDTAVTLYRDADVLDTWFSSGLWPIGTLGWPEDTAELSRYFPTSVLITGQDILFFWVARMMMMQLAVVDQIPFHDVYLHGLVRDAKGKKMSKSTGNVIDPLEIIDEYGADALRFSSAAMAALGGVLKLDMNRIAGYRNFGTKLWNAARFAEMNDCKPAPGFDPASVTETLNRWIVGETARTRETVDAALTGYRFNDAATALYSFVWNKVCDWHVEFSKPLMLDGNATQSAETRTTMAWVIDQCLVMLHPIMPFITEELWSAIAPRDELLMHANWPDYTADALADAAADREMGWVIGLIEDIRSLRAQMHVPAGAKVPLMILSLDAAGEAAFGRNRALIERLARVSDVSRADTAPKGAVTIAVEGGTMCLPLGDIIDIKEEIARLDKTLAKLAKDIDGTEKRLANAGFVANAPADVIEESRERVAQWKEEAATLQAAKDRLSAAA